jgi:hypothetical protein
MLLDPATDAQMQAAGLVISATMAGFLAARMFGDWSQRIRLAIAVLYIAGVVLFVAYVIL